MMPVKDTDIEYEYWTPSKGMDPFTSYNRRPGLHSTANTPSKMSIAKRKSKRKAQKAARKRSRG